MFDDLGSRRVQVPNPGFLLAKDTGKIVFYDNSSGSRVKNENQHFMTILAEAE